MSKQKINIKYEKYLTSASEPLFVIELNNDGKILFNGFKNVKITGKKVGKISNNDINNIVDHLEHIYFFSLNDTYRNSVVDKKEDLRIVTISIGDRYKKISYDESSKTPLGLSILGNMIEGLAKRNGWVS